MGQIRHLGRVMSAMATPKCGSISGINRKLLAVSAAVVVLAFVLGMIAPVAAQYAQSESDLHVSMGIYYRSWGIRRFRTISSVLGRSRIMTRRSRSWRLLLLRPRLRDGSGGSEFLMISGNAVALPRRSYIPAAANMAPPLPV